MVEADCWNLRLLLRQGSIEVGLAVKIDTLNSTLIIAFLFVLIVAFVLVTQ
jgi:hypothetical protein